MAVALEAVSSRTSALFTLSAWALMLMPWLLYPGSKAAVVGVWCGLFAGVFQFTALLAD